MKAVKVVVRGQEWTVRFTHHLIRVDGVLDCLGACDARARTLTLSLRRKHADQRRDTVVHELLHAALFDLDDDVVDGVATDMDRALDQLEDCGFL